MLLLLISSPAAAQFGGHRYDLHEDLLTDEVEDVFTIGQLTYVIQPNEIVDGKEEPKLADLVRVSEAARVASPDGDDLRLLQFALGGPHTPLFHSATTVRGGLAWHLQWWLLPPGQSTGAPFEYRAMVNADGSRVPTEVFLLDSRYDSWFDPDEVIFSCIRLSDLHARPKTPPVSEAKAGVLAKAVVQTAVRAHRIKAKLNLWKVETIDIPLPQFRDGHRPMTVVAFRARFVAGTLPINSGDRVDSFDVWVSAAGKTSTISRGGWTAKSQITK